MRKGQCIRWLALLIALLCAYAPAVAEDAAYEEENLYMDLENLVRQYRHELSPVDKFPADIHTGDSGFYPTEWLESRRDAIHACQSAADLSSIFWVDEGTVSPADEAFIEGAFDSAGYGGMPYRYYLREEGYLVAFTGNDGEAPPDKPNGFKRRGAFAIYLQDTDTEPRINYAYVPFRGHVYETSEEPLSPGKRQLALSRATAFVQAYAAMTTADSDIVMVSDMVYTDSFLGEYTYVWFFDRSYTEDGEISTSYDPVDPSRNEGFEVVIGLDRDRVLGMWRVRENVFVNRAQAETDWTARTGQLYPIMDDDYMLEVIGPRLSEQLWALSARYYEDMTLWEQQQAEHLSSGRTTGHMAYASEWEALRADVEGCEDAAAFSALLHRDYLGITESFEGEPQRAAYEALAQEVLAAMGIPQADLRTFMYRDSMAQGTYYEVHATQADPPVETPGPYVYFDLWADGRVDYLWAGLWGLAPAAEPLTDAQRLEITSRAVDFARTYARQTLPEGAEATAQVMALWSIDTGDTLAQVWIPLGEGDYYGETRQVGLDMMVGLREGIIYEMKYMAAT